jgi:hypothetical protein
VNKSSVQAKIFEALSQGDEEIKIIAMSQSSDGLNLSMVISKEKIGLAVSLIDSCVKCI